MHCFQERNRRLHQITGYLAVDKGKDVNRDTVEFAVDRANDALHCVLSDVDAWAERTGVVFGQPVQPREAHHSLHRRYMYKAQIPQLRRLLLHHHLPLI